MWYRCYFQPGNAAEYYRDINNPDFNALRAMTEPAFQFAEPIQGAKSYRCYCPICDELIGECDQNDIVAWEKLQDERQNHVRRETGVDLTTWAAEMMA